MTKRARWSWPDHRREKTQKIIVQILLFILICEFKPEVQQQEHSREKASIPVPGALATALRKRTFQVQAHEPDT
jgi:hypothetical protein